MSILHSNKMFNYTSKKIININIINCDKSIQKNSCLKVFYFNTLQMIIQIKHIIFFLNYGLLLIMKLTQY